MGDGNIDQPLGGMPGQIPIPQPQSEVSDGTQIEQKSGVDQASSLEKIIEDAKKSLISPSNYPELDRPEFAGGSISFAAIESRLAQISSDMWDKFLATVTAISEAQKEQAQQKLIEGADLTQTELASSLRDEAEQLGALAAQMVVNLAVVGAIFTPAVAQNQSYNEANKALVKGLSKEVALFLGNEGKMDALRAGVAQRIDQLYGENLDDTVKQKMLDEWTAMTSVSVAFSALGVVLRADNPTGKGPVGMVDVLQYAFEGEAKLVKQLLNEGLQDLSKHMSKEEIAEFLTTVSARFGGARGVGTAVDMVSSFVDYLKAQSFSDDATNEQRGSV